LFSALENDLYALLFNEEDEDEEIVTLFNDEIQQIISEFKLVNNWIGIPIKWNLPNVDKTIRKMRSIAREYPR